MKGPDLAAPGSVRWVVRVLEEAGYQAWAVGGAIRNALLGLPPGDWDLTTRAPPAEIRRLFPRTVPIGIEHGTVGVLTRDGQLLEVTTFRRDVETFGRRAVIEFADTLEEDLARRDFTVNAIAWHPLTGEFQDPFDGKADLRSRLLRTVGRPEDRFAEDLLRVLRGLRFSGRFGMEIDEATWRALCGATGELERLSPERVREELEKVLAESVRPSGALTLYLASGVMEALYPELAALLGRPRPAAEEDLLVHSFLLADALPRRWPLLRLAALVHGLGAQEEADTIAALMLRLRFSNADTGAVLGLVRAGMEPPLEITSAPVFRRWLHTAGKERVKDVFRVWLAKARLDVARLERRPDSVLTLIRSLRRQLRERPPLELEDLAIDGRDLIGMGLKPGPYFGRILSYLLDRVLENPRTNDPSRLRDLVEAGLEEGKFEER